MQLSALQIAASRWWLTLWLAWAAAQPAVASASTERDVAKAVANLDAWQLEDALEGAQALLLEHPDDPAVIELAAQVQYQRGEHRSALALARAAERAGYDVDNDFMRLIEGAARYETHFETLETPHFRIKYLNKDKIVASLAVHVLEAAYERIGKALDFKAAEHGEKIVVEIYPDARGLSSATGLTLKEIETSGTIAVCKFHRLMITSPLAAANGYGWADTIAHEFVHLLVSKKSRNTIPIWLHEGIAKYYESVWNGAPGRALKPYSEKLLADATRKKKYITFAQMHPSMAKLPSQDDAALAFAEVFTAIEFLRQKYGEASISQLLTKAATGQPLNDALRSVFQQDLKGIETQWLGYLKTRPFKEVPGAEPQKIKLALNEEQAKGEKPLEKIEDKWVHDHSRLGELLQMRGHEHAAIIEYEKAYQRSSVRYATLVNRLARAYAATDRPKDALRVLDAALLAHPSDSDAHLLAGRVLLNENRLQEALDHFEAVQMQNPFNPEMHASLVKVYEALGKVAEAARQREFLELASRPRPTRRYELPEMSDDKTPRVRLVTPRFGRIKIDDKSVQSPVWDEPLVPGVHRIEFVDEKAMPRKVEITMPNTPSHLQVIR